MNIRKMANKKAIFLPARADSDKLEAGCDEAGRGPLAGPVFAAAVILPADFTHPMLNDSKQMSEKARAEVRKVIEENAIAWAVAEVSAEEIDCINILNASITAMWRAVAMLPVKPEALIIDGNKFRGLDRLPNEALERPFSGGLKLRSFAESLKLPYTTYIKGDGRFASIAAASVLAKTHRDECMRRIASEYPQYGWEKNMGYPTAEHIEALRRFGPTPYHRMTFKVKELERTLF